jgi:hypothetical protein
MVTSLMTTAQKLFHSLFSPPRPTHASKDRNSKDEDHNKNSTQTGISSAANVNHLPRKGYQQDALFAGDKGELRGVKEDRCQFTFSDGRRCRNQHAQFCVHHSSRKQRDCAEGAPDSALVGHAALEGLCANLTTATNINRALSQVFLLMAQGRISQKQAVAFGYLTQLLLQTLPGIRSEFVSVHGYRAWEQKLKSSLEADQNEAPEPSGGESKQPMNEVVERREPSPEADEQPRDGVVEPEKGVPITPIFGQEKVAPPSPPSPDYTSIFHRSLDLLDRKFDNTPEGRREAGALMTGIEQINRVSKHAMVLSSPKRVQAANVPRTKVMQIRSFRAAKKSIRSSAALKKSAQGAAPRSRPNSPLVGSDNRPPPQIGPHTAPTGTHPHRGQRLGPIRTQAVKKN